MNVLITSGGGAKGAFSVGALEHILHKGPVTHFDFISGTSTGSLIAGMVAANKIGELIDIYMNTNDGDILAPVNLVEVVTSKNKPFIFDTEPLMKQIETFMDEEAFNHIMQSSTNVCFNSVCLQTGKLSVFSTKPINDDRHYDKFLIQNRDELVKAMLASSNQAVFMNPVNIGGKQFVDGGNKEVVPTRVVVNNLGSDSDHDIYILSNNPDELVVMEKTYTSILDVLMRAIAIFIQEVRENDLEVVAMFKKLAASKVRIFYICPDRELDKDFPTGLRFNKSLMEAWIARGQTRAKQILKDFPNGNL